LDDRPPWERRVREGKTREKKEIVQPRSGAIYDRQGQAFVQAWLESVRQEGANTRTAVRSFPETSSSHSVKLSRGNHRENGCKTAGIALKPWLASFR